MAKNDYHVIVYRILLYLYTCLKGGEDVDPKRLDEIALAAGANERYWHYILCSLLDGACITPRGIEYLTDNSFMAKVRKFLKEAKDIAPFI